MSRRLDAHHVGFLVVVVLWGLAGRFLIANRPAGELEELGRLRIFSAAIVSLWLLFGYIAAGLYRRGQSVRSLIDPLPLTPRRLCVYSLLAVGMFCCWGVLSGLLGLLLRPDKAQIQSLLVFFPRGPEEKAVWAVMSLSAAFCEEFAYRGYLQNSIRRISGSISAAVIVQALAYGFAHAALPWKIMVTVTVLGIFFGAVAAWQKSLIPGMLMHAGFDLLAAFVRK